MKTEKFVLSIIAMIVSFMVSLSVMAASPDSYEPDNFDTQASFIAYGTSQSRSISPVGDFDWAVFVLDQPANVIVETIGTWPDDTELWLWDDQYNVIGYNDDKDSTSDRFSKIDIVYLPEGTYYIQVGGYSGGSGDGDITTVFTP